MDQFHRFDSHLIGIRLEVRRLDLGWPRIGKTPADDRRMLLVHQLNQHRRPETDALLLEKESLLPEFIVVEIPEKSAALEGDITVPRQPGLLGLVILGIIP